MRVWNLNIGIWSLPRRGAKVKNFGVGNKVKIRRDYSDCIARAQLKKARDSSAARGARHTSAKDTKGRFEYEPFISQALTRRQSVYFSLTNRSEVMISNP